MKKKEDRKQQTAKLEKQGILVCILILLAFFSCSSKEKVLNFHDNTLRAGASAIVISPLGFETFNDNNNNGKFEPGKGDTFDDCGRDRICSGDPNYTGPDADGTERNGVFDAVWIAGYGAGRPANGIHDDIYVRTLVVSYNREYFISIAFDFVGILLNRVEMIKDKLEAKGYDRNRILVTAIHDHEGPDTMGMWGPNEAETGIYKPYMDYIVDSAVTAVEESVANLQPAELTLGQVRLRDTDPYNTGIYFGGRNDKRPWLIGIINDIRDPLVVHDYVVTMQFKAEDGSTIATLFNFSGHPEVESDKNNFLSADYVGYARKRVEQEFGGIATFIPSTVGGMMSSLGGAVPLIDEGGKHVYQLCTQDDIDAHNTCLSDNSGNSLAYLICETAGFGCTRVGDNRRDYAGAAIPEIIEQPDAPPEVFDYARSVGFIVGEGAISAINNGEKVEINSLIVKSTPVYIPIDNPKFDVGLRIGIFEVTIDNLLQEPDCGYSGCVPDRMFYIKIGNSAEILSIPGELFPELALGLPDDPEFYSKRPNKYFRQHNDNEKYSTHANPYIIESPPLFSLMKTKYKFIFGLTNDELGYIMPEADFYDYSDQGDHYEESNSTGPKAIERVHEAAVELTME